MSDKGTIEQLRAELVQAREELVQAQTEIARVDKISDGYATGWADACAARDILAKGRDNLEKSRQFFIEMAEGRDKNLAQARAELKDLQGANRALGQQVAYVTKNRDYWYETALAAEIERDEIRKEAEGLRRQLAEMRAGHNYWLDRHDDIAVQLAQVEARLIQAQADLDAEPIEIEITGQEMVEALQAERRLRREAEQRAERAEALATLVTEKTAALLIRLGTAWTATLPDDGDIALELAARIREALGVNDA